MGMLVSKDNLGFGMRSWRYAAVVEDGVIEAWFEEPGFADDAEDDPYGKTSPQNVLDHIVGAAAVGGCCDVARPGFAAPNGFRLA